MDRSDAALLLLIVHLLRRSISTLMAVTAFVWWCVR